MATKKKTTYPVREPVADDAFALMGILAAAGAGDQVGTAVAQAIRGYQTKDTDRLSHGAATAIIDGLQAALRDPGVQVELKSFIYRVWDPKFSLGPDETYEDKKRDAWTKMSMRGPFEIIANFRKTEGFADFLAFFTEYLPATTETSATDGSTSSSETTDTQTK